MASPENKHTFLEPPDPADGDADYLGKLGHYRVIRELGKGGMGYVFLAEDTRLKREVALKVMNQKIAATPGSRKRFISEARAMASVHHDNVATIFEVGEQKGTPYMAMELLEGSTLEDFKTDDGRPDYKLLIDYATDIARGLAAAHAQGIVHRDIKPANIWLDTKTNRIKILDFGLALASTPVDQLSGRGSVVGTPGYLSPEQARSEPLDDRSDLFSTGVVLYELATGKLPLKAKSVAEQLISILAHPPRPLRELNEKIPQPLAELIHKLMAKEPRDRYSSANELAEALEVAAVECESKTEMAQAINQLQLGLQQVVQKKETTADVVEAAVVLDTPATPNPFESLPDAIAPATEQAPDPFASPSGSGAVASPSGAAASKPQQPTSATELSNRTLIWIAVGAVVLLIGVLVPALVYWTTNSAIARQSSQATVIELKDQPTEPKRPSGSPPKGVPSERKADVSDANLSTKSTTRANTQQSPKQTPIRKKPEKPVPAKEVPKAFQQPPAIQIQSTNFKGSLGNKNTRWVVNANGNNGSFEKTNTNSAGDTISNWTLFKEGDGGWKTRPNAHQDLGSRYAFVGKGSRVLLRSEKLNHVVREGDVFRMAIDVGTEGNGLTDFSYLLCFDSNDGAARRYEMIREAAGGKKWTPNNPTRIRAMYTADAAMDGRRPYLELVMSNMNRSTSLGMLDRVILTVEPAKQIAASQPSPTMVASESTPMVRSAPNSTGPPLSATPTAPDSKKAPVNVRIVDLTTNDELGADATVKRGLGSKQTLGAKPSLAVQTRNGVEIQHTYLRFNFAQLHGETNFNSSPPERQQGKKKTEYPTLTLRKCALALAITSKQQPTGARLALYGFNDPKSDVWPEEKLVWNNSLSKQGLESLPLLAETEIASNGRYVRFSDERLDQFLSKVDQKTVTLVIAGEYRNDPVIFASREDTKKTAPTLRLGIVE